MPPAEFEQEYYRQAPGQPWRHDSQSTVSGEAGAVHKGGWVLDRFLCIQAFVRVAETQSFATAARQLGVTPSVVTTRIKQLEKHVQAALFHRSTRKVALSETAKEFLEECVALLANVDSLTDRMRQTQDTPLGSLRLQVLPGFALGPFARVLRDFSLEYSHIRLDVTVSDKAVNPIDEGYDVALQLFRPGATGLIAQRLFTVSRVFCASPQYLKVRGVPMRPTDLLKHDTCLYSAYPTRNRWVFRRGDEEISVELPARVHSNSVHLLRDFARIGGGITCLPTLVCIDDLVSGALIPLLSDYEMPPLELLAIYPVTHRGTVKVKLFVEFTRKRFLGVPKWDRALLTVPGFTPKAEAKNSSAG